MNEPEPLLLAAARGRNRGRPPVWIMRQAGRYLKEYRDLRARYPFKTLCEDPALAEEVSLLPERILGVDAVIVFYDILLPVEQMGAPLRFTDEGPVFLSPVATIDQVEGLRPLDLSNQAPTVLETIARIKRRLGRDKPVLGFGGAPFTLAAYLIEGELGKSGEGIRRAIHRDPKMVRLLLARLAESMHLYLKAQIDAGADAVQLFDTWAGLLGPSEYREFALPYEKRVLEGLPHTAASILYVNGGDHLLEDMAASGADVVSVDWRGDLTRARERVGSRIALQGNLDPAALFAPPEEVRKRVRAMLESRRGDPGYIANLGHGILPDTPLESARAMVETVKAFSG